MNFEEKKHLQLAFQLMQQAETIAQQHMIDNVQRDFFKLMEARAIEHAHQAGLTEDAFIHQFANYVFNNLLIAKQITPERASVLIRHLADSFKQKKAERATHRYVWPK